MCYSEHVFHSGCGHWELTRVYHKSPNADRVGFERGCWNRQSTGSVSVNSSCDGCLFNPEATTYRGTYFCLPSSGWKDAGGVASIKRWSLMALCKITFSRLLQMANLDLRSSEPLKSPKKSLTQRRTR